MCGQRRTPLAAAMLLWNASVSNTSIFQSLCVTSTGNYSVKSGEQMMVSRTLQLPMLAILMQSWFIRDDFIFDLDTVDK